MASKVLLLLGTKKGAFVVESSPARRSWQLRGPYCEAWPINHVIGDAESGAIYAGGGERLVRPSGMEVARFRRKLDAFGRGLGLCPRRGACKFSLEPRQWYGPPLRRS